VKLARAFFMLSTLLISLGLYRIPIGPVNLSFAHVAILAGVMASAVYIIYVGQFRIKKFTGYVWRVLVLFLFASGINAILLTDAPEIAFDLIGIEIMGSVFVFLLPIFFRDLSSFGIIHKAYYYSAFFTYLLNAYALGYWLETGRIIAGVPFWRLFSKSEHVVSYIQAASNFQGFPRFRFPFASAGGTGVFLAICGIFIFNEIFRAKTNWVFYLSLFAINTFFLIGTFSRTGWIILFIGVLLSLYYLRKFNLVRLKRVFVLSIAGVLVVVLLLISVPKMGQTVINRFSLKATVKSNVGHIESRLLGLTKFCEAPLTGIGIGNLWAQGYGLHTHSVYTSFLAERGIFILLLYLGFMFLLLYALKSNMKYLAKSIQLEALILNISLFSALIAISFGHLLYQIDSEFVWLFYGLALSFTNLRSIPRPSPIGGQGHELQKTL